MSQHPTDMFRTSCGATAPLELKIQGPGCTGGERRVFEQPFVLVGRQEGNCLRLEDEAVSRQHAYLQQLGGRVFCVDLGSRTGIRWGGEPRPAGWLRPEQGIQIGPYTLELATTAPTPEESGDWAAEGWDPLRDRAGDPRLLPQVTVEVGNEVRARVGMNWALMLVGSSPACRIRLRDVGVSRYHCSLLRTPQGVWLIDLLPGNGACLNGQSVRWAPVKDGDRLQVGPYVLRVWYPDVRKETLPPSLMAIAAGTPAKPAHDTSESGQQPSQDQSGLEPALTEASTLVATLRAELDQARESQRDVEVLRQSLADSQAECDRLRDQVEVQAAVLAGLQTQLEAAEASAGELAVIRGERDHWQAEAQNLQARLAADAANQEEHLGRLAADLHTAQTERDRLQTEQQTSRHSAEQALARVSDLERALTEAAAAHKTALAEARAGWESERQALAAHLKQEHETAIGDVHARATTERDEWRQRLETAEASARELAVIRGERDHWQAEAQSLRAKLAADAANQEQLDRLATDLHAAQAERDRLQTEQQTSQHSAEQALARISDLERALTEATAAHETAHQEARAGWESERQALAAQLEQERQSHDGGSVQTAIRDVQARAAVERSEWRQRLESAQQQLVWERGLFQTQSEQLRQQVGSLQADRDRLVARLAEAEMRLRTANERSPDEANSTPDLQHRQQAARDQVFVLFSGPGPGK